MNSKQITKESAEAARDNIEELMNRYKKDESGDEKQDVSLDIQEYPLEIQVNFGWHSIGSMPRDYEPVEYKIITTTGGPHVEVTGKLDVDGRPKDAKIVAYSNGKKHTIRHHQCEEILEFAKHFTYSV